MKGPTASMMGRNESIWIVAGWATVRTIRNLLRPTALGITQTVVSSNSLVENGGLSGYP
jgi:hypothetical protein